MLFGFGKKKDSEKISEKDSEKDIEEMSEENTEGLSGENTEGILEENPEGISEENPEEILREIPEGLPKIEENSVDMSKTEEAASENDTDGEDALGIDDLAAEEEQPKKKTGFFTRLKEGLTKTRNNIVSGIDAVFSGFTKIDEEFYEELEEILIMGDIGIHATEEIIDALKQKVKEQHISKPEDCKTLLVQTIKDQMRVEETAYEFEQKRSIVFVIGVNGVGKTTSIGKLAAILKAQGRHVLIAAADTFRAAAGEQLAEWSRRSGVEMIGGVEGADPASVIFDGINAAKARKADVLLCDTAGRLHNKKNLMEELKKMNRIIDREFPGAHRENLIVLDATTGQNALMQAKEFSEAADLTGIILTKKDGTAKGGIAVAIQSELGIPVKYIGVGEKIEDLQKFDSDRFVDALFDVDLSEDEEEIGE